MILKYRNLEPRAVSDSYNINNYKLVVSIVIVGTDVSF